jgi:hypothetical protein
MDVAASVLLVERLMITAFCKLRDPRSDAYKLGVRELLNCRSMGLKLRCWYKPGTAEADAFYSGVDEGNRIWREHLESEAVMALRRSLHTGKSDPGTDGA